MKLIVLLCLLLSSSLLQADIRIETVQLQHRTASDLLPKIVRLLPEHASAEAYDNLIILRADQVTLLDMRELIAQLDTPLQNLVITVLRSQQQLGNQHDRRDRARLEYNDGVNAELQTRRWSTQQARDSEERFQARTLAGQPVSIQLGQDVPVHNQTLYLHAHGGLGFQETTQYIELDRGFQAVANVLANGQVQVDIHPAFSQLETRTGIIDRSAMLSSVSGELGEWIMLGHIADNSRVDTDGYRRYRSQLEQQQWLYMRVELQP